jgi:hypothetical protein
MNTGNAVKLGLRLAVNSLAAPLTRMTGGLAHKPKRLFFEISRRCNLKCLQCGRWRADYNGVAAPLTKQEWLSVTEEAGNWLGGFYLCFTSAEPFMEEEALLSIVRKASCAGAYVNCTTNGTLLGERNADAVAGAGFSAIDLSLDSLVPEKHDRWRGAPGTHAKVLRAIDLLRSANRRVRLSVSTIIMRENLHELTKLAEWARERRVNILYHRLFDEATGAANGLRPPEPEAAAPVLDRLAAMKRAGFPINNSAGYFQSVKRYYLGQETRSGGAPCARVSCLSVLRNGDVHLCPYMEKAGNIREAGLEAIWRSAKARSMVKEILACRKPCFSRICNFQAPLPDRVRSFFRGLRA